MSNSTEVSMNTVVMSNEDLGSSLSITTDDHHHQSLTIEDEPHHSSLAIDEDHSESTSMRHVTLKDDVSLKDDRPSSIHQIDLKEAQTSAIHEIVVKDESNLLDDQLTLQVDQHGILERDSENDD